jgi:cell wall assembly regulator SMI1
MVHESLSRIEHWLAAQAPRILHDSLNPGATESQLAELETAIGRPLPADYQALYRWHNGLHEDAENWGSLFYGMSFLPLAEVLDAFQYQAAQTLTSPLRQAAPTLKAEVLQNPWWLRLGFDGSHGWLCVDLDPTPAGTYGEVIYVYEIEEIGFRVAGSVAELLATFAHDLEQGLYKLDEGALEDENEFLVPNPQIDLGNWEQAARWQDAFYKITT